MTTRQLARWYFLASGCFWASLVSVHGFLVLTAQEQFGLPADRVTFPLMILHFAVVLLEVPTGAIADSWSRARSAVVGQLLVASSLFILPMLKGVQGQLATVGLFLFALLFASGWSFFSGSLKGLVSQHIREQDSTLMLWFVKTNSAWNNAFILVVTILYPALYKVHWKLVWFTAGTLALLSFVFALPLIPFERTVSRVIERSSPISILKSSFVSFRDAPGLMKLSAVSVILFSLATTFESTLQAHAATVSEFMAPQDKESFQSFLSPAWFGWFFLTAGSLVASTFDLRVKRFKKFGETFRSFGIMSSIVLIFFLYAFFDTFEQVVQLKSTALASMSFLLGWLLTTMRNENASQLQTAIVHGQVTSTIMSINSLFQDLLAGIFLGIFLAPAAARAGFPWSWAILAMSSAIAIGLLSKVNLVQAKNKELEA